VQRSTWTLYPPGQGSTRIRRRIDGESWGAKYFFTVDFLANPLKLCAVNSLNTWVLIVLIFVEFLLCCQRVEYKTYDASSKCWITSYTCSILHDGGSKKEVGVVWYFTCFYRFLPQKIIMKRSKHNVCIKGELWAFKTEEIMISWRNDIQSLVKKCLIMALYFLSNRCRVSEYRVHVDHCMS
jgi:hypothetical protein